MTICKTCHRVNPTKQPEQQPQIFCLNCGSNQLEQVDDELPFGNSPETALKAALMKLEDNNKQSYDELVLRSTDKIRDAIFWLEEADRR